MAGSGTAVGGRGEKEASCRSRDSQAAKNEPIRKKRNHGRSRTFINNLTIPSKTLLPEKRIAQAIGSWHEKRVLSDIKH